MRWQLPTSLLPGVLALAVTTPALIAGQTPGPAGAAEKMVAPGMACVDPLRGEPSGAARRQGEHQRASRAGKLGLNQPSAGD